MKANVVVDTSSVDKMLKGLPQKLNATVNKALAATAERGIGIILDRTAKGKGYKGMFAAYNRQYAKFRLDHGRKDKPDLNYTGKMLGSMRSQVNKDRTAEIKFSRLSEAKKAVWNNQKRTFFGFNQKEKSYLRRFFGKYIKL